MSLSTIGWGHPCLPDTFGIKTRRAETLRQSSSFIFSFVYCWMVAVKGLQPLCISADDFESSSYGNSDTPPSSLELSKHLVDMLLQIVDLRLRLLLHFSNLLFYKIIQVFAKRFVVKQTMLRKNGFNSSRWISLFAAYMEITLFRWVSITSVDMKLDFYIQSNVSKASVDLSY